MDYKIAYIEILEKLRKFLDCWRNCPPDNYSYEDVIDDLENRVPELKESEDERTRKELIELFRAGANNKSHPYKSDDCKRWLSWLEKQGESNLANSEKTCKVEPKFKAGDWVIHGSQEGIIYQVEKSFLDGTYRIVPVNDKIGKAITAATEDAIRLWTIQDVKCGDIIYHPKGLGVETISIVRGWEQIKETGRTLCSSIVLRVADNEIVESSIGAMWWKGVVDTFYPATKEQRALLFQKMKEAGYEWDAEKKDLRKIEPNSAWSEEDKTNINKLIGWTITMEHWSGAPLDIQELTKLREWLKALENKIFARKIERF